MAISALFILVNSPSSLRGNLGSTRRLPSLALMLAAVVMGSTAGSYFGSRRFPRTVFTRLLAVVFIIAGAKLIFTR